MRCGAPCAVRIVCVGVRSVCACPVVVVIHGPLCECRGGLRPGGLMSELNAPLVRQPLRQPVDDSVAVGLAESEAPFRALGGSVRVGLGVAFCLRRSMFARRQDRRGCMALALA